MPELTTEQRQKLSSAFASMESIFNRPSFGDEASRISIRGIIAQILEEMGPSLLQILIAMLLNPEVPTEKN